MLCSGMLWENEKEKCGRFCAHSLTPQVTWGCGCHWRKSRGQKLNLETLDLTNFLKKSCLKLFPSCFVRVVKVRPHLAILWFNAGYTLERGTMLQILCYCSNRKVFSFIQYFLSSCCTCALFNKCMIVCNGEYLKQQNKTTPEHGMRKWIC